VLTIRTLLLFCLLVAATCMTISCLTVTESDVAAAVAHLDQCARTTSGLCKQTDQHCAWQSVLKGGVVNR
jgi:hypothetical protein